jgi:hypothetical protein
MFTEICLSHVKMTPKRWRHLHHKVDTIIGKQEVITTNLETIKTARKNMCATHTAWLAATNKNERHLRLVLRAGGRVKVKREVK